MDGSRVFIVHLRSPHYSAPFKHQCDMSPLSLSTCEPSTVFPLDPQWKQSYLVDYCFQSLSNQWLVFTSPGGVILFPDIPCQEKLVVFLTDGLQEETDRILKCVHAVSHTLKRQRFMQISCLVRACLASCCSSKRSFLHQNHALLNSCFLLHCARFSQPITRL